jgi:hypothetical protein
MKAAERLDRRDEVRERIRASIDNNGFVAQCSARNWDSRRRERIAAKPECDNCDIHARLKQMDRLRVSDIAVR